MKKEFNKFIEEDDEMNEEDNEFQDEVEKDEEIIEEFPKKKKLMISNI